MNERAVVFGGGVTIHLGRALQKRDISNLIPETDDNMDIQYGSSFKTCYEKHWKIKG